MFMFTSLGLLGIYFCQWKIMFISFCRILNSWPFLPGSMTLTTSHMWRKRWRLMLRTNYLRDSGILQGKMTRKLKERRISFNPQILFLRNSLKETVFKIWTKFDMWEYSEYYLSKATFENNLHELQLGNC